MNRIICSGIALFFVLLVIASVNVDKTATAGHAHHPFINCKCHGAEYACDGCYGTPVYAGHHHNRFSPVGYPSPIQSMHGPIQKPYAPIQSASASPIQTAPIQAVGSPIQAPGSPIQKLGSPIQNAPAPIQAAALPPIQKAIPSVQAVPTPIQKESGPIQTKPSLIQVPAPIQATPVGPIQKTPGPIQTAPTPIQIHRSPIQKAPLPIQSAMIYSALDQEVDLASVEIPVAKKISAAFFNVIVPEDAKIYVNGYLTKKTGAHRAFQSNVLEGVEYQFEVRAERIVDGEPMEQNKTMTLRAGQKKQLEFGFSASDQTNSRLTLLNR